MPLLSLNNLSFTYSRPTLLDGITLHIERGERIGLVGRNGAGKSTLMKLISGLIKPDNGSVDLQAEVVSLAWIRKFRRAETGRPMKSLRKDLASSESPLPIIAISARK